jgi:hypothetical protein
MHVPTSTKTPRKRAAKKPTEVVEEQAAEVEEAEESTPELSNEERNALLKQAYSTSTSRLREENRAEFDRLYIEEAAKLGVVYTPKPSPEQKAKQDLEDLLAKFPHLRDQLVNETVNGSAKPPVAPDDDEPPA